MSAEDYDPEWLELEQKLGGRPCLSGSITEIRAQFQAVSQLLGPLFPSQDPSVRARDVKISYDTAVRIYTPDAVVGTEAALGVYYHGGGFALGNLDTEDADCRYLAQHTPCIIVAVEYDLAPETKFPAILEQCVLAYKWAWDNAASLGASPDKVFAAGTSAGGGLALAVANALISEQMRRKVCGLVVLCPLAAHPDSIPTAYKSSYKSYDENATNVPLVDKRVMFTFYEAAACDPSDAATFVTLSKNLGQFPPTYIATAEKDVLRDDGVVLEEMLRSENVMVERKNYRGLGHCFWANPMLPTKREVLLADTAKAITFVLSAGKRY